MPRFRSNPSSGRPARGNALLLALGASVAAHGGHAHAAANTPVAGGKAQPPNMLVIILDDMGMDQMSFPPFGWNSAPEAPALPVLAEIASEGVSFRNFWSTPECSPSRAAMLTGRHGIRTNVVTAVVDPMLPTVQLHPSEVTVPKLLREKGYISGMLGKYHLGGGPENTPPGYGYEAPSATAGLDFYDGYWDLPPAIDTTLGGQAPTGTFDCGGVLGVASVGAACFPDGSCIEGIQPLVAMSIGATPLLRADGTLAQTCGEASCSAIDFTLTNAYYAWPRTIANAKGAERLPLPHREYLSNFIARRTREWVDDARESGKPWLAFTTHSIAHTPIQTPPPTLTGDQANSFSCSLNGLQYRQQYRLMAESVDRSIGDMLVGLGLGSWTKAGFELGDLEAANTMLVVFNDNGTYGFNVLPPFDPNRAKQTVYETGVRSPLIIAGPLVAEPGRSVDATVSIVDLFGLLCDVGGADWQSVATPSRPIDALPMAGYLTNPAQDPLREFDFAVYRQGTFANGTVAPCLVSGTVIDGLITNPSLCASNGGCWATPESQPPYSVTNYCDLLSTDPANATFECGGTTYCTLPPDMQAKGLCPDGSTPLVPPTLSQYAVRRGQWKLVVLDSPECLAPNDCSLRLYRLPDPVPPNEPGIERADGQPNVWDPTAGGLPAEAQAEYDALRGEMVRLLADRRSSPADGNLDGVIDGADLAGIFAEWGSMGFWDANTDGIVDGSDLGFVLNAWGEAPLAFHEVPDCLLSEPRTLVRDYPLDKSYADAAGSGVDAQPLGGTLAKGAYVFGPTQGLRVATAGLDLADFAIELDVTVDAAQFVLSKLIDFTGATEDVGFYREGSGRVFSLVPPFSPMGGGSLGLGERHTVRLERSAAARTLSAWIDGRLQWLMADPLGLAVPDAGEILLFVDDTVTNSAETCSGRLHGVRIWSATAGTGG